MSLIKNCESKFLADLQFSRPTIFNLNGGKLKEIMISDTYLQPLAAASLLE